MLNIKDKKLEEPINGYSSFYYSDITDSHNSRFIFEQNRTLSNPYLNGISISFDFIKSSNKSILGSILDEYFSLIKQGEGFVGLDEKELLRKTSISEKELNGLIKAMFEATQNSRLDNRFIFKLPFSGKKIIFLNNIPFIQTSAYQSADNSETIRPIIGEKNYTPAYKGKTLTQRAYDFD